jgi:Zn finger protein HypA/HybF involved in hydrogenase expression
MSLYHCHYQGPDTPANLQCEECGQDFRSRDLLPIPTHEEHGLNLDHNPVGRCPHCGGPVYLD